MKVHLPAIKFLLSQTYLSWKLANWLTKIQEHDLTIEIVNTIKGRDLALHLSQNSIPLQDSELEDEDDPNLFVIDSKSLDIYNHTWYSYILYYLNHENYPESLLIIKEENIDLMLQNMSLSIIFFYKYLMMDFYYTV